MDVLCSVCRRLSTFEDHGERCGLDYCGGTMINARIAELEAEVARLTAQLDVEFEAGWDAGRVAGVDVAFADGLAERRQQRADEARRDG